ASSRTAFSGVALGTGDGSAAAAIGLAATFAGDGFGSIAGAVSTGAGVCSDAMVAAVGLRDWRMKNHATAAATRPRRTTLAANFKPILDHFRDELTPGFRSSGCPPRRLLVLWRVPGNGSSSRSTISETDCGRRVGSFARQVRTTCSHFGSIG